MRRLLLAAPMWVAASHCGPSPTAEPVLRVSWAAAAGPTAGLPPDLEELTVRVLDPSGAREERTASFDRGSIEREESRAVVEDIPIGEPVELRMEGLVEDRIAYTGTFGPVVLRPGERRYVDLLLVPAAAVTPVAALGEARAFHSSTTLGDGRVLFAGGFTGAEEVECETDPEGSRCFDLQASSSAVLYDPSTGRTTAAVSMASARAGHTATRLEDGRVLLVGGAASARFVLTSLPDGGLAPSLRIAPDRLIGTVEIFDPEQGADEDDPEGDGDPGRGSFTAQTIPGRPRALHTASLLPDGSAVLVAGGSGADGTSEIWAGGEWTDAGPLGVPRQAHVAVSIGTDEIWLIGGAFDAGEAADVVEVFAVGGDGASGAWTGAPALEPAEEGGEPPGPGLNMTHAAAGVLDDRAIVVFGWTGPVCEAETPTWEGLPCPPADRAFALDTTTGRVAQPIGRSGERHAWGIVAPTPDGGLIAAGGFEDLEPTATAQIERLTGEIDMLTVTPVVDENFRPSLGAGRAALASCVQRDGTVVVSGGLAVTADGLHLSDAIELINPPR